VWIRPHVHVAGAPPSLTDRCATAFLKRCRDGRVRRPETVPVRTGERGVGRVARAVHASKSSLSGTRPGVTARTSGSLLTGTFPARHTARKTALRYEPQNVDHSDAAAEFWSMSPLHDRSSTAACWSAPESPAGTAR